jgi:formylglycine-generating enzyme required for sulfatase activity
MKKCPQCDKDLPDDACYCLQCGTPQRKPDSIQASAKDSAVIAQQDGVAARQVAVGRDVQGNIILVTDPEMLWQAIRQRPPDQALHQSTECYLSYIVDRYQYLNFSHLHFKGKSDLARLPLHLSLLDTYVPLTARTELPKWETWTQEERLSERRPILDILRENDGLIILGDPGAGKTTFLKYLALKLASGKDSDLNLDVQLPVLIPLSAYAAQIAKQDIRLDKFATRYFQARVTDLPLNVMLKEALKQGGALILLDGIDTVANERLRRKVINRVMDFYASHRREGNRFVLTSRIVGYQEVRPSVPGLVECTLENFNNEEIEIFVDKWTAAIEKVAPGHGKLVKLETRQEQLDLLKAIRRNPSVRRLASNPLLLTILALMKRRGAILPEHRVQLYDQYVDNLIKSWNQVRSLDRTSKRDLDVTKTVRVLAPLALWMRETSPGLVKQGDLQQKLPQIYQELGEEKQSARQFLKDVREYACLLVEKGARQYGFIHQTFEEYLAAVGIARLGQRKIDPVVDILIKHIENPEWREVILLTIGYLGIIQQREETASDVVQAILERKIESSGKSTAVIGHAVADAYPIGVTPECIEFVTQSLVSTIQKSTVDPKTRADAGRALAKLDDPRSGVNVLHLSSGTVIPDIIWCYVPPGPFTMGEGATSHLNKSITKGYLIARYPITNIQFHAFVKDGGYKEERYWQGAKQERVWIAGKVKGHLDTQPREIPYDYGDPFNLSNHPVVGVTWYEALAYCHWLAEKLQNTDCNLSIWRDGKLEKSPMIPEAVMLPSEAEWEKAARGLYSRRYPWGDNLDRNRANYEETRISTTCAVGCFPGGTSPYGIEDLSGNVWEWTRSLWKEYHYEPYDGREDLTADKQQMLRGGSFSHEGYKMRCAYRFKGQDPSTRLRAIGFRVCAMLQQG